MDAVPASSAPELPIDLAFEILSRLPVKTLVRFKSVCKLWRSVIESPLFISRHLNRSVSCGGRSLIVEYRCPDTQGDRMALLSAQTLELTTPVEIHPHLHSQVWRILGCCNGVVCLAYGDRDRYLLWNPAMRQYRVLPECRISPGSRRVIYYTDYDGFGYDPATDDYKIVRVYEAVLAHMVDKICFRAEVFALGEGSWREIPSLGCEVCSSECVSVGGVLYWWVGLGDSDGHHLLSFDLRDEVFRPVCIPDLSLTRIKELAPSEGSLCLIAFDHTVNGTVLDLWVMDGGPGMESWTKRLSIGAVIGFHRALSCVLNGGIVVEKIDGTLAICEAGKESLRDLPVKGARYSLDCQFYVESLVRVIR